MSNRIASTALFGLIFLIASPVFSDELPTFEDVIKQMADSEKKLVQLQVESKGVFEEQDGEAWKETPTTTEVKASFDREAGGRVRIEVIRQLSFWEHGLYPIAESSYEVAFDGREGCVITLRDGAMDDTHPRCNASITRERPAQLSALDYPSGASFSNVFYDRNTHKPLSESLSNQAALTQKIEGAYSRVEAAEFDDGKCLKISMGNTKFVDNSWFVDPARGMSLIGMRSMTVRAGKLEFDSETHIQLTECAPQIWYPIEVTQSIRPEPNKPPRRYHYKATKVTANGEKFPDGYFSLKIPGGYFVDDQVANKQIQTPPSTQESEEE